MKGLMLIFSGLLLGIGLSALFDFQIDSRLVAVGTIFVSIVAASVASCKDNEHGKAYEPENIEEISERAVGTAGNLEKNRLTAGEFMIFHRYTRVIPLSATKKKQSGAKKKQRKIIKYLGGNKARAYKYSGSYPNQRLVPKIKFKIF